MRECHSLTTILGQLGVAVGVSAPRQAEAAHAGIEPLAEFLEGVLRHEAEGVQFGQGQPNASSKTRRLWVLKERCAKCCIGDQFPEIRSTPACAITRSTLPRTEQDKALAVPPESDV